MSVKRTHPPFGREHEDGHAVLALERVLRGRPRIAGGRAQHVERRALPGKLVLEERTQELQRDVLERERRTVGDVKQMQTALQRRYGRDVLGAEDRRGVGPIDDPLEVRARNIVRIAREDFQRELAIGERPQARQVSRRQRRIRLRHREAAVGGERVQQDRAERTRLHASARAYVAHHGRAGFIRPAFVRMNSHLRGFRVGPNSLGRRANEFARTEFN